MQAAGFFMAPRPPRLPRPSRPRRPRPHPLLDPGVVKSSSGIRAGDAVVDLGTTMQREEVIIVRLATNSMEVLKAGVEPKVLWTPK